MKDKQINIRVDENVFNLLEFKSKSINLSKTDYIIKAIINSDIKIDNSKNLLELINAINKIGNNINQISKNLNIAHNSDKLGSVNYNNLLDKLIIIEAQLEDIYKEKK